MLYSSHRYKDSSNDKYIPSNIAFLYYDQDETISSEWPVGNRMVYQAQDTEPWEAEEVYRLYSEEGWWTNTFLLCCEDRIIEIQFDWEPTAEQMEIVAGKLNP